MTKRLNKSNDAAIGLRIKGARMAAKITQEQLGEALGLTFQQVQKYERGINRVGAGQLPIIAATLKHQRARRRDGWRGARRYSIASSELPGKQAGIADDAGL